MEESGAGSVLVTKGSGCGSERPKNIWILRIRIRNTEFKKNGFHQILRIFSCIIEFFYDRCDAESAMIANPSLKAYRYDPYSKEFTQEFYAHDLMKQNRKQAIETAKVSLPV